MRGQQLKKEFFKKANPILQEACKEDWFNLHTGVALAAFFTWEQQHSLMLALHLGYLRPNVLNKIAAFLWRLEGNEEPEDEEYLDFSKYHFGIGNFAELTGISIHVCNNCKNKKPRVCSGAIVSGIERDPKDQTKWIRTHSK